MCLSSQALRAVGSGCATQADVDWVWQEVQSQLIRDMAFKDNLRTDGRGFIDTRLASFQVQLVCRCCFCAGPRLCSEGRALPAAIAAPAVPAVPAMLLCLLLPAVA